MTSSKFFIAALALLVLSCQAHAAPPSVSPVTVNLGSPPAHVTPHGFDAAGIEVAPPLTVGPAGQCTIFNLPTAIATVTYDATGALLTAAGTGSAPTVTWKCVNGQTTVFSAAFTVTVPWSVIAVGSSVP